MTRDVSDEEIKRARWDGRLARNEGAFYLYVRILPTGRCLYLTPWSFGGVQLGIGTIPSQEYEDVWHYQDEQALEGWRAALGWDGQGEPEGWYRHPHSGRRRPGGDPAKEFVQP